MDKFKLIIVEDVPLELKGTEGIVRNEIPEAEVIGTADDELSFWRLIKKQQLASQEALIDYEIDEYDERFLRHLALGYTKEQITTLRGMPFGVKSLEKRQNDLVKKLFPGGESVNATRLVVRAIELRILDIDNLVPDAD